MYSQRFGPQWHSHYYHAKFAVDQDGNQLSEEEAKANFDAEWQRCALARCESALARTQCLLLYPALKLC